jgi:agmatine deiminase
MLRATKTAILLDRWALLEIPQKVARELNLPITSVPMVNEGVLSNWRAGNGTLMAKCSSILNPNRNKGWKKEDAEAYFRRYLGATNFIWLEGAKGRDITDDQPIDGTARFANGDTIVTFHRSDFLDPREYDVLCKATNAQCKLYKIVHLPVTKDKRIKREPGICINSYIGNEVVILPTFDDPNDKVAEQILQNLYTTRTIIGVDFTERWRSLSLRHSAATGCSRKLDRHRFDCCTLYRTSFLCFLIKFR